jgi:hypothetical protein
MQLDEAYERLARYGPEFGGDEEGNHGMTNHGPMAVEVMTRRGLDVDITRWLDRYVCRLDELPAPSRPIEDWTLALGDHRRLPDWQAFFAGRLAEQPWTDVLGTWWPRLLPGIAAGSTHGVIRVGHAVRALRAGPGEPARRELARGLAFWAARYLPLPAARPAGPLAADAALRRVTRLADQSGFIAHRAGRLAATAGWAQSTAAIRPAPAGQEPTALAELVTAAVRQYPEYGPAAPVLLVHTATAPNAVRHVLPSLPRSLWADSFRHAWTAVAAIQAMYAPVAGAADRGPAPAANDAAADALHRAAEHGDEHVLKFTDTAVDVFDASRDPGLLSAAARARELIARP